MKKYLLVYKPQSNIYQAGVKLYDSEEETIEQSLADEQDIIKIIPIEI